MIFPLTYAWPKCPSVNGWGIQSNGSVGRGWSLSGNKNESPWACQSMRSRLSESGSSSLLFCVCVHSCSHTLPPLIFFSRWSLSLWVRGVAWLPVVVLVVVSSPSSARFVGCCMSVWRAGWVSESVSESVNRAAAWIGRWRFGNRSARAGRPAGCSCRFMPFIRWPRPVISSWLMREDTPVMQLLCTHYQAWINGSGKWVRCGLKRWKA